MPLPPDRAPTMREIINTFSEAGGKNWADTILDDLTDDEVRQLKEAIDRRVPKKGS